MNKGWFVTPTREGDRTLEEQMLGLAKLVAEVPGKSVIDFGCAEGLIDFELVKAGASGVVGFEIVKSHVAMARELAGEMPCHFDVANLNEFTPPEGLKADIVVMLAILHKLRDPSAFCRLAADMALELCVIRLPPSGPVIRDERSEFVRHDIGAVMNTAGFDLESVEREPRDEWVGYFRRRGVAKAAPAPQPPAEVKEAPATAPAPAPVEQPVAAARVSQVVDVPTVKDEPLRLEPQASAPTGDAQHPDSDATNATSDATNTASDATDASKDGTNDAKSETETAKSETAASDASGRRRARNTGAEKKD